MLNNFFKSILISNKETLFFQRSSSALSDVAAAKTDKRVQQEIFNFAGKILATNEKYNDYVRGCIGTPVQASCSELSSQVTNEVTWLVDTAARLGREQKLGYDQSLAMLSCVHHVNPNDSWAPA